jgi:hypothetical protein
VNYVFDGLDSPVPGGVREYLLIGHGLEYILKLPPTKNLRAILKVVLYVFFAVVVAEC